jgi:glutamine amidotransferase
VIRRRQGDGGEVALVDYGAGNLTSVRKALSALGARYFTPDTAAELEGAAAIIVPGVGHFEATRAIDRSWRTTIEAAVDRGAALFGICLGMQWLFEGSDEAPGVPGLGAFRGSCGHLAGLATPSLEPHAAPFKVPHVGWNSLRFPAPSVSMRGLAPDTQVYFTHSYVAPVVPESSAITTYGIDFTAAVERGRIAGVQFHPEKSGDAGLRILKNWLGSL